MRRTSASATTRPRPTRAQGSPPCRDVRFDRPCSPPPSYGFDKVIAGGITGLGQAIAVVEDYHDTCLQNDVNLFDKLYGLPALTAGADLSVVGDTGGAVPTQTTTGPETALDVEWAHAIAPGANILLVETNGNLAGAARYAASVPGVSAVSISYGSAEFAGEKGYDTGTYVTPAGHAGVTFVASAGDNSKSSYAAASPNVLAVGGTTLTLGAKNAYGSEVAWADGGGGVSPHEAEPAYQQVAGAFAGRVTPDVSYDASYAGAFQTYVDGVESYSWGTSAAAPQWAALVALADQQRAQNGLASPSSSQTLSTLYHLYDTPYYDDAFHDVTTAPTAAAPPPGPGSTP